MYIAADLRSIFIDFYPPTHHYSLKMLLGNESDTYHRDRYSAMENIESSISDLGNMFRQLASLVSEQGEVITRFD